MLNTYALHEPELNVLCLAVLCNAMLSRSSLTLPVFEEKVLVVAGEGWGSNVEQCSSCCARTDGSCQRRRQFAPFLQEDKSSVLTCLVFLGL